MLNQTSRILNKIFKSGKFIEIHTSYFKNFEKNIRQNEKLHQHSVDEDKNSIIQ